MASKVKKGILYYIAWAVFILVGLFCIFAVILIFNPGKDVFGINFKYVSDNRTEKFNLVSVGDGQAFIRDLSIETINVNSGFTDIKIETVADYENVTILLNKKIVGFSDAKDVTYKFYMSYQSGILNITVEEPKLNLSLSPNATLTIFCPKTYSFKDYSFNINTTSGDVYIGSNTLNELNLKQLNVSTKSGYISVRRLTNINSGNCYLDTETSNIDIYADIKTNLNINTKRSKIYIDQISGNLSIYAEELKSKCNKILGNVEFSSKKGYITIDELGNLVNKTNGHFYSIPDSMHIANIIINKMAGDISLPNAEKSDITVTELYGNAYINTTSGNIKLENAFGQITLNTTSGSVNFTQMSSKRTYAETVSGKIYANFNNISDSQEENTLKTEKANISINFNPDLRIVLNYNSAKGFSASWVTSSLEKQGTLLTPNTESTCKNILNATTSTSGSITISNALTTNK